VAAVLTGVAGHEIPFYESEGHSSGARNPHRERYEVRVVTDGTHDDAAARGAETGRTAARLLAPDADGVRIPRGLDTDMFWKVLEQCCARADEVNAKRGVS